MQCPIAMPALDYSSRCQDLFVALLNVNILYTYEIPRLSKFETYFVLFMKMQIERKSDFPHR